jgi:lipopolysaccharide transport system permease protein
MVATPAPQIELPENLLRNASKPKPPQVVVIEPHREFFHIGLKPLWEYHELLYFLVWRDIKVRYKQTAIGAAWAILQPLLTMLIFAVVFGRLAKMPSDNIPYPIFAFSGLLPWTYFSQAISRSGVSLVGEANLIRKIYFPRLIIPMSAVVAPIVDFGLSFGILLLMMVWYRVTPTLAILAMPLFLLLGVVAALGTSLWLSALNVRYRDVGHAVPFLVQFWMYASPIVYPLSLIPKAWRPVFSLNPIVGVVEGFRWGLLGKQNPDVQSIAIGAAVSCVLLLSGLVFFKRMERTFADIV